MTHPTYVLADRDSSPPAPWTYWVVEGQLLAGAYPGSDDPDEHRTKIQTILDSGITAFFNLMEESEANWDDQPFVPYEPVARELRAGSLSFQRFAIPDLGIPTPPLMTTILDAVDESLKPGQATYVHCWGGVGRTGTVVGCWLLRHGLATPDDVLTKLAWVRKQDKVRGHREAPETAEQRRFVREWTA